MGDGRFRFQLVDEPEEDQARVVLDRLVQHAVEHVEPRQFRKLNLFIRDADGRIVGGLRGHTVWRWLSVETVWVHEELRGQGLGRELMLQCEAEARSRGCIGSYVNTFDFQAVGFYRSLDYVVFGELEDFPPGHSRFFLRKRLSPTSTEPTQQETTS